MVQQSRISNIIIRIIKNYEMKINSSYKDIVGLDT